MTRTLVTAAAIALASAQVSCGGEAATSPRQIEAQRHEPPFLLPAMAFVGVTNGNEEIYVMSADGSRSTRLTNPPGSSLDPAWSPDGSRIAFASDRDGYSGIYVMHADGTSVVRLTYHALTENPVEDFGPTWSPDGRRIAFERMGQIFVMNADGSGVEQLTNDMGAEVSPSWSPDGRAIAVENLEEGAIAYRYSIGVMNSDGSGLHRVASDPPARFDPAWSPDGKQLVFSRADSGKSAIFAINAAGTNERRLSTSAQGIFDATPSWSPDGRTIAFSSNRDGNDAIFVMDASGSAPRRVSSDTIPSYEPAWSPLAFMGWITGPQPHLELPDRAPAPGISGRVTGRAVLRRHHSVGLQR